MTTGASGVVRAAASRFVASWRTDFADPASLAGLRGRILTSTGVGSMVSTLGTGLTKDEAWTSSRVAAFIGAMIFLTAVAVFSWRRGARMGDVAFASIVYLGYPVIGFTVPASDPTAAIPMVAICTLLATTLGVLFIQRSAIAYVGVGLAVATVSVVAVVLPSGGRVMIELLTCVLCLAATGITMRLVRDLAISALVRSRQVEATDALTQLLNRRGLERAGAVAWDRAARAGLPLSAMVLDVDHFKRINDEQGHAAGDEVLRRMGALLRTRTRDEDVVARLGGEEFLVLSTCVPDNVDVFAERLRRTIETELGTVTVSIGVHTEPATLDAAWPEAVWAMVNTADHALYRAKEAGRNRVVKTVDEELPTCLVQQVRVPGLAAVPALPAMPALPGQRAASPSPGAADVPLPDPTPGRRLTDSRPRGSTS